MSTSAPAPGRAIVIFAPLLAYCAVDLFVRMTNALAAPLVADALGLGPVGIGVVTGAFFVAFGLTQFPLGIALDRFGPRPVVLVQVALAVTGALVCRWAPDVITLAAGRALLGVGYAGSFMVAVKAATLWLDRRHLPLVNGLIVVMVGTGGMLATGPFAGVLPHLGWRDVNLLLAGLAGVLLVALALAIPAAPRALLGSQPLGRQVRDSLDILRSRRFWHHAPVVMTTVGAVGGYQTLWAPLWLRDVAGYPAPESAWVMFGFLACLTSGGLVFGWLGQALVRRGHTLTPMVVGGIAIAIAAQVLLALGAVGLAVPLWLGFAFVYACPIALFSVVVDAFPRPLAARASSSLNMMLFLGTFATQWGVGAVLARFPTLPDGGHGAGAYRAAMLSVVAAQVAALLWYLAGLATGARGREAGP